MKLEFSRQIFEKYSNIIFQENLEPSFSMRTERRRADMMNLIVAFRNFANAPKKIAQFGMRFEFLTTVPLKT